MDLRQYGIPKSDAERIAGAVSESSMSGNPLPMDAAATAAFVASLL
jgi:cytochrome c